MALLGRRLAPVPPPEGDTVVYADGTEITGTAIELTFVVDGESTVYPRDAVTAIALSPEVRPRLIQRTRDYIRRGYPILDAWMEEHEGTFSVVPPQAAAIAFVRYHLDVNSTELVNRLMQERSVLIVPGDHFGLDHHLRVSYGLPPDYLRAGLDRIHELIVELGG